MSHGSGCHFYNKGASFREHVSNSDISRSSESLSALEDWAATSASQISSVAPVRLPQCCPHPARSTAPGDSWKQNSFSQDGWSRVEAPKGLGFKQGSGLNQLDVMLMKHVGAPIWGHLVVDVLGQGAELSHELFSLPNTEQSVHTGPSQRSKHQLPFSVTVLFL